MAEPNRNDDLSGLARDILRELKATGDLVLDAARLGKDELLHYVSESMRSSPQSTVREEPQPVYRPSRVQSRHGDCLPSCHRARLPHRDRPDKSYI